MKKVPWRIKDLVDLEYFLQSDEGQGDESARMARAIRDREIYLQHIQSPEDEGQVVHPGRTIRTWLEQRRHMVKSEKGPGRVLPGEAFEEIYRLLGYGFLIFGLISGLGLAFSFLNYRGIEPLNVSSYLGSFIFIQLFLLLLLMMMTLIRTWRRSPLRSSVIYVFVSGLIGALIVKLKGRALNAATGTRRDNLEAVIGLVKGKQQIYGSLFYWPVFLLAQIFMIGFNLGVLVATLVKVTVADIAFGWQSTVLFSVERVLQFVRAVALPWSWFVPQEIAYPSLSQIEGSHMILKDGIYHLATEDLVSWWPFLCLAVLCYGLLPRLLLLFFGLFSQKRALGRIDFGHRACEGLLRRLTTPLVSTTGRTVDRENLSANTHSAPENAPPGKDTTPTERSLIALIPDEIFETLPEDALEKILAPSIGYPDIEKLRFGEDEAGEQGVLDTLSLKNKGKAAFDILIVQEAWQPPIKENLLFIKALRRTLGKSSRIRVGLIGRPHPGRFLSPVKEEDWKAWQLKISALGDPYLGLERLVINEVEPGS